MALQDIELIAPPDGAVTQPLQRYYCPTDEEREQSLAAGRRTGAAPIQWDALKTQGLDRSLPAGVLFEWDPLPAHLGPASYELRISERPEFRETMLLRDLEENRVEVLHLHIATRYYWRVAACQNGARVAESKTRSFLTHDATPRWIAVPGMTNVRDLGGWPLPGGRRVRQGMLYRSSEMNSHVLITEEGKRILTDNLRIRTDLDLRSPPEDVRPVLDPQRVEWINIPVMPYSAICEPRFMEGYRRAFAIFADHARYPLLFHCWGGADRAGTLAFLVSALLGKEMQYLARDYELTSLSIWGERSRWSQEFQALLATLAPFGEGGNVNRQGGEYLLHIGVTAREIERLRGRLISA